MPRKSKYVSTEAASCLHINSLAQKVKKQLLREGLVSKSDQEAMHSIMSTHLTNLEVDGQKFQFSSSRNHLGGARWFALCPKCGAKSIKLFKPDRVPGMEQSYMCAKCHGLKSPSALYGDTTKYRDVIRPLKRMTKIREILRTSRKLTDEDTASLMKEHEKLKIEMESSVIYQRLKFKLEAEGLLKGMNY